MIDNPAAHRIELTVHGATAFTEYQLSGQRITFTHTEVPPSHEGQGVGTALIEAALASARERKLEVIPTCQFFASYMKRHAEVQDLLAPHYRKLLDLDP